MPGFILDKVSGLVELDGHGFSSAASHGGPLAALIPSGRGRDRDRERGKKIGGDQGVSVGVQGEGEGLDGSGRRGGARGAPSSSPSCFGLRGGRRQRSGWAG